MILDIWLPEMDGIEVLAEVKRQWPELPVVMMSGHGTIETAVKATKLGAYDFVEKPLSLEKTLLVVERALEHARLERENRQLRERIERAHEIIGTSPVIVELRRQIATAAPTNGRVLDLRRERRRQGAGRAGHPRALRAARPALRGGELRGHPRRADRVGALRPREGRLHRGDGAPPGQVRAGHAAARSSSTRSATCRSGPRPRCSGRWRSRPWSGSAGTSRSGSTCA